MSIKEAFTRKNILDIELKKEIKSIGEILKQERGRSLSTYQDLLPNENDLKKSSYTEESIIHQITYLEDKIKKYEFDLKDYEELSNISLTKIMNYFVDNFINKFIINVIGLKNKYSDLINIENKGLPEFGVMVLCFSGCLMINKYCKLLNISFL